MTRRRSQLLHWVQWPVRRLATLVVAYATLAVLIVVAHVERRRRPRSVPRIFWAVNPAVEVLRAHGDALRRLDYPTARVVTAGPGWSDAEIEVDEHFSRAPGTSRWPRFFRAYATFRWTLRHCDIVILSPDWTILRATPLEYRQLQLLRVARKKILLLPHGPDVRIPSRARDLLFKHALSVEQPAYARAESGRLRDLEYVLGHADHIVSGADWVDSMPWWDRLRAAPLAVDVAKWRPNSSPRRGGPLVVLHALRGSEPTGTEFLERACDELAREGVPIELKVVEHPQAESRRRLLEEADVVAEQFVAGWYGQLAVEGMSMEKPVLSYLRPDLRELYTLFSFAGDCPIVDTGPGEVKEKLRELAADADARAEIGRRGRQYVRDHHSLEALAAMLDEIFKKLSSRSEVP